MWHFIWYHSSTFSYTLIHKASALIQYNSALHTDTFHTQTHRADKQTPAIFTQTSFSDKFQSNPAKQNPRALVCRCVTTEVYCQNTLLLFHASAYQEIHLLKNLLRFQVYCETEGRPPPLLSDNDAVLLESGWSCGCGVPQLKDCGFFVQKHLPCLSVLKQGTGICPHRRACARRETIT